MEPLKRCGGFLLLCTLACACVCVDTAARGCRAVLVCGAFTTPTSCNASNATTWCHSTTNRTIVDVHRRPDGENLTNAQTNVSLPFGISNHKILKNNSESDSLLYLSVEVNLRGNILVLDLTYFTSAITVIINTNGFLISRVCGATNFSSLTVKSSSNTKFDFINSFTNLKSLNLSHNKLETFTESKFPQNISTIDLSFNNITLDTNVSLPQSLRVFNLSSNGINNNHTFILKGNVIVLDIRKNKLSSVPVIEMITLEELYLSNNEIKSLKENTFSGLVNLTILDLRANHLRDIEERVFQGLNRLQWLDLSENNLMSLEPATFQYLNNLVTILLSKNINLGNLQDIEDASLLFGTGQRLQEIEASGTNLSRIPSTVTRSVRKLLLTDNTICTIQCGEVDSFPLLQVIDVSNNMISDIEEDALGRLEFLSELLLAGNRLVTIPKSLPSQLQRLDLRCNSINKLGNTDFLGMQKLRVLLISMNNISVIEDGAFGQLISLDVLDLSYNPIKTLYRSSFTGPRRLKELYLISLTELIPLKEPLTFPAPESSHLEVLYLDSSPELANRLMDDVAALTMFHALYELSLRDCGLRYLRKDLPSYLPRLNRLKIIKNPINCTDIMWLSSWLRSFNLSAQAAGIINIDSYNIRFKSCKYAPNIKIPSFEEAKCATPQELMGMPIASLPDVTTERLITVGTSSQDPKPEVSQSYSTETTSIIVTNPDVETNTTDSSTAAPTSYRVDDVVTKEITKGTIDSDESYTQGFGPINSVHSKKKKIIRSQNKINKLQDTWKYYKNQTTPHSTLVPLIVLLNDTKQSLGMNDNQVNGSLTDSEGSILAHAHVGHDSPTSHPGMMVFLVVVGVILVAASGMVYSHYRQTRVSRRSAQYQHQHDIEVASLGGHELW